jgi:hypothetical protein
MNCCCVTHNLYRNKQYSKVMMLIDIPYYLLSLDYLCYEVGGSMAIATWVPAYSWKWRSGGSMHACMLISPLDIFVNRCVHKCARASLLCTCIMGTPWSMEVQDTNQVRAISLNTNQEMSCIQYNIGCSPTKSFDLQPPWMIWYLCPCSPLKCHYIHNAVVHTPTIVTGFGSTPWWWRL